jgi:MerR family transcriptional regulator, redox-sensitive transcriptional activator SoxR
MLTIGEVASQAGLRASAIRFYEEQGLLPKPSRHAGRRTYPSSILKRLAVIELAKAAGFSLTEIRALLSKADGGRSTTVWKQLVPGKTLEIDAQMRRLIEMKGILWRLNACTCATIDECGQAFIEARSNEQPDKER